MSETCTREEFLAQCEALLSACSNSGAGWHYCDASKTDPPCASREEMIARMGEALARRDSSEAWCVWFRRDGEEYDLFVCLTGNGPTSEAHAQFIAAAPVMVATLLRDARERDLALAEAERRCAERILAAVRTEAKRLIDHGWDGDAYAGVELLVKRVEEAAHHKETP